MKKIIKKIIITLMIMLSFTTVVTGQDLTQTLYYNSGDIYEGEVKDGMPHGKGKLYLVNIGTYEGDFKNSLREGWGKTFFINGIIEEGIYKNDLLNGQGKVIYPDGSYLEGTFIDGDILNGKCGYRYNGQEYITEVINGECQINDIEGSSFENFKNPKVNQYVPYLVSEDGQYLGKLTTNIYDFDSIYNKYGTYGSKYSTNSIWNEYGLYGGKYSSNSPFNKYTSTPPAIYLGPEFIGYLTVNKFMAPSIHPDNLYEWLMYNNY